MRIETPRLVLDALTAADAAPLAAIAGRPDVAPMLLIFPVPCPVPFMADVIVRSADTGAPGFRLAIREGGRLIGSAGCSPANASGAPSVMYFVDPAAAGRGVATEAMAAFVPALQARFDPPAIVAEVFDDNPASARVLGKLGFVAVDRYDGTSAGRVDPAPLTLYRRPREART